MYGLNPDIGIHNILGSIKPAHLLIVFLLAFIFAIIMTFVLLYHFNKYREYSPKMTSAKNLYLSGLIILSVLAIIFLTLFIF